MHLKPKTSKDYQWKRLVAFRKESRRAEMKPIKLIHNLIANPKIVELLSKFLFELCMYIQLIQLFPWLIRHFG